MAGKDVSISEVDSIINYHPSDIPWTMLLDSILQHQSNQYRHINTAVTNQATEAIFSKQSEDITARKIV